MAITAMELSKIIEDSLETAKNPQILNNYAGSPIKEYMSHYELSQMLKDKLTQYGIEFDIDFSEEDIWNIENDNFDKEKFKGLVEHIYSTFSDSEKQKFLSDCLENPKGYFRYFFENINDEDRKYACFNETLSNRQKGLIINGITDKEKVIDILKTLRGIQFYQIRNYNYRYGFTLDDVIEIVSDRQDIGDNDFSRIEFYRNNYSVGEIIEYLKSEPDRFDCLIRLLSPEEIKDVLISTDNDAYKAKLLFSGIYNAQKSVIDCLPYISDEYLRTLVFYKATYEDRENEKIEHFEQEVDKYQKFRNQEVFF